MPNEIQTKNANIKPHTQRENHTLNWPVNAFI